VAVEAVVHEDRGTPLQRLLVVQVDRGVLELGAAARGEGEHRKEREEGEELLHHQVTRAGSGRSLSLAVYHGISTKKRK
jgi:hypothetical protein